MTQTLDHARKPIFFPPAMPLDPAGVIEAPPFTALATIAAAVHPDELLLFTRRLIDSTKYRRRQRRWAAVNQRRLELARLCIDRILAERLADLDHD